MDTGPLELDKTHVVVLTSHCNKNFSDTLQTSLLLIALGIQVGVPGV